MDLPSLRTLPIIVMPLMPLFDIGFAKTYAGCPTYQSIIEQANPWIDDRYVFDGGLSAFTGKETLGRELLQPSQVPRDWQLISMGTIG